MKKHARISGMRISLPDNIMTNNDIVKLTESIDEWIKTRVGIFQRYIANNDEKTSALASQRALEYANITAKEIDLIITATTTPDLIFPSTSCLVQGNLGAQDCAAFDINAVCSGFIYYFSSFSR